MIENLRHPLTAPKRHICAAWDLPRKSKNLRPCAVHFGVLHKAFFLSYFVLANHSVTPAFLPFGTWADPEKIVISLWANPNFSPSYYSFNSKKRAGNPRISLFKNPTGKGQGQEKALQLSWNFPNISPSFPILFFYFSCHILLSPRFLERKGRMRYGRKKSLIGPRKAS